MKKLFAAVVAAVLLLSLGVSSLAAGANAPTAGPKGKFKIGKYRLFLTCAGSGKPTVVLDAGLGGDHNHWAAPVKAIARQVKTKVCAYDRFNTGESGGSNTTRTIGRAALDLHKLVRVAKLKRPLVLASISMGGLIDREYARRYPKDVAGLVMFDTAPDDWDLYTLRKVFRFNWESLNVAAASAALRARDSVGAKPVIVVRAGETSDVRYWAADRGDLSDFENYWDSSQRKLALISTNSLFVVATRAGHMIPVNAPKLTFEAIRLVAQAARKHARLPECTRTKLPSFGADCDSTPVPPPAEGGSTTSSG